jgi:hypothetical protein
MLHTFIDVSYAADYDVEPTAPDAMMGVDVGDYILVVESCGNPNHYHVTWLHVGERAIDERGPKVSAVYSERIDNN